MLAYIKHKIVLFLRRFDYQIMRLYPEDRAFLQGYDATTPLPSNAITELVPSNTNLRDLEARYSQIDSPVSAHTYWKGQLESDEKDLRYFRGETAYIWHYYRAGGRIEPHRLLRLRFYTYAKYVSAIDTHNLLGNVLTEDGAFGCHNFDYPNFNTPISRDLLDSVNEIHFLDRHWNLLSRDDTRIIDIGAGYGRLAHRILTAAPNVSQYWCTDAIPRSTFLCEYYLRHRRLLEDQGGAAHIVPLDKISESPPRGQVDLAINVHSFSEMCYAAVETWANWLVELGVSHLFVVPNEEDMLTREDNGERISYLPALESAGFRIAAKENMIQDADVRELYGVNDYYLLFERD